MQLLIDGYNLIPAIPELGRLLRQDLEAGREGLLAMLRAYRRTVRGPLALTVVFDGKGAAGGGGGNAPKGGGVQVLFSRNETADDLILRLLRGEKIDYLSQVIVKAKGNQGGEKGKRGPGDQGGNEARG